MAGGPAISVSLNGHYNGKITWFVVASCVVAAMGGAIFGYDIGVSGKFFVQQKRSTLRVYSKFKVFQSNDA